MSSAEEWAEKFGSELKADAGKYSWNREHQEKLALYFRQAMREEREQVLAWLEKDFSASIKTAKVV